MRKYITLFILAISSCSATHATTGHDNLQEPKLSDKWAFRENKGQITDQYGVQRNDIQFQLNINNTSVFIGQGKIHYQWNDIEKQDKTIAASTEVLFPTAKVNTYRLDVTLLGCNTHVNIIKEDILPDVTIFYAQSSEGTKTYSYQKITYQNIYPNIDWVFYVRNKVLKYDFVIRPGGKVSDIQISYSGATDLKIEEGALIATGPMGSITEQKPYSYIAETGKTIRSAFALNKNVLNFITDTYEGTLIIDPELRLEWGTYYGGIAPESGEFNGSDNWSGYNNAMIATDDDGNIYLTGTTSSNDNIATTGSHQSTRNNASNVFLAKFNNQGERIWASYYGGSAAFYALSTFAGRGHAVACDTLGNVYLTGSTWNTEGIASPNSYQTIKGGAGAPAGSTWYGSDLFLAKFDRDGVRQWATYYGGEQEETGGSVAVTPDGSNIYLAGITDPGSQSNYKVVSPNAAIPYSGITNNMPQSGFLVRFNESGQRIWGTYINPTTKGHTSIMDIALDHEGHIYLSGTTHADPGVFTPTDTSIATWGSFQQVNNSPYVFGRDAFLQKWDSMGTRLWGTFYGGDNQDQGFGITCDDTGNVYMTGGTSSTFGITHGIWCIATQASFRETLWASASAFLVKFNGLGQRQWGTYFNVQRGNALAYATGKLYLAGSATNDSLATPCAYQEDYAGLNADFDEASDGFLAQFNNTGYPDYVTYYGGEENDFGCSVAVNNQQHNNIVYLAGGTRSPQHIATPGSHKEVLIGNEYDVFLAKFYTPHIQEITSCFKEDSLLISAKDTSGTNYQWNNNITGPDLWVKTSGSYSVRYEKKHGCITIDSFLIHIYPLPMLTTEKNCPGKGEAKATVHPGNNNSYTYSWYSTSGNLLKNIESNQGDILSDREAGNYKLNIQTPIGCDTNLNFIIEAFPAVNLTVSNDTTIAARNSVVLWATGAEYYKWLPDKWLDNANIPTPIANPNEPITYTVTGINEYGCSASKEISIDIMENLFIPNAFSPNGDGQNDEFKIVNYGYQRLLEFRIFNRWGEQVFWTMDPDKGWNGSYKGKSADIGSYAYYIRLQDRNSKELIYKGEITLVR